MSAEDLRWAIGIAVSAWLGMAGIIIGMFRSTSGKIDKVSDALHERINRVRDEYVRRVDLDDRLKHLQETQSEMRADIKAIRDTLSAPTTSASVSTCPRICASPSATSRSTT